MKNDVREPDSSYMIPMWFCLLCFRFEHVELQDFLVSFLLPNKEAFKGTLRF